MVVTYAVLAELISWMPAEEKTKPVMLRLQPNMLDDEGSRTCQMRAISRRASEPNKVELVAYTEYP